MGFELKWGVSLTTGTVNDGQLGVTVVEEVQKTFLVRCFILTASRNVMMLASVFKLSCEHI